MILMDRFYGIDGLNGKESASSSLFSKMGILDMQKIFKISVFF